MKKVHFVLVFLTAIFIFNSRLYAEPRIHDGLFLRFQAGFGYGETVEKDFLGSDMELSGNCGLFIFQLGYSLTNNFVLFGELGGFTVYEPDVEWGGLTGSADDTSLGVTTLGIGMSYYITPVNIYFSVSLNTAQASTEVDGERGETEWGYGATFSLGKEWWVSGDWGLGFAVIYHLSQMESDEGVYGMHDVTNNYFGIAFSATFN